MPALQGRQEKAAQYLASGLSQKAAFEQAGYSYTSAAASVFFKKPTIAARVKELMQRREARIAAAQTKSAENAGVTREWVIERLKYAAEVGLRGAPKRDKDGQQMLDASGKPIFDGKLQLNAATRALQLLGIDLGMFVQRHEVGDPGEFARLTNEELETRVAKDMKALGIDDEAIEGLIQQFSLNEDSLTLGEG